MLYVVEPTWTLTHEAAASAEYLTEKANTVDVSPVEGVTWGFERLEWGLVNATAAPGRVASHRTRTATSAKTCLPDTRVPFLKPTSTE